MTRMFRYMCKSKIHRATITHANLHYKGSITVDERLMEAADLRPFERVQVLNVDNGSRVETYVITGPRGSGVIGLNGPTARMGQPGDVVLIVSYALMEDREIPSGYHPTIIHVDARNRPLRKKPA